MNYMIIKSGRYIFLFVALFIFSCDTYTTSFKKRAERAAEAEGNIVVGIVENSTSPSLFLYGVRLAVKEINQKGGILGRKIETVVYDDMGNLSEGQKIANKLAKNNDVIAVVGHNSSEVAASVSITYEETGIVFISYAATAPDLTLYSELTFRNIPDDEEIGRQEADFAHKTGFKKTVVFYERDSAHKRLAEIFYTQAEVKGIRIVTTLSYFEWENDFRSVISMMKKEYEFDSVFIAGTVPSAVKLIKQMRGMGVDVPILGGSGLDSPELWTIAGRASEGTVVPTVFNPEYPRRQTLNFVEQFESEFGFTPDTWAAQGYDAISVLGSAIEESGSSVPMVVGTTLRFLENREGVTGSYSFTPQGDITGKEIFFKKMHKGHFVFLKSEQNEDMISVSDYVEDLTLCVPAEGRIPTIDPGLSGETLSIEVIEQLFLALTDFDPKTYQPVPELALSWTVSADGMTYQFQMREDAMWTDGSNVTAHDVVWAIQRNIRPETKSPYVYMLYILENAEEINSGTLRDMTKLGVRAIDDYTVEFRLRHVAHFPAILTLGVYRPLPRLTVERHKEKWTDLKNIETNGPYMPVLWKKGVVMVLRKNPDYYEAEKVSIPEIRYYVIEQSSLGLAMYENNELDVIGGSFLRLPLTAIPRIMANPALSREYSAEPLFCTYAYGFNTKLPPVDNPLVRKAISAAIDRQLMTEVITGGGEEPATTFARPPVFGAVDPKEGVGISFAPHQAREWLSQAGYPDGRGFPEITLLYNVSETHSKIAEAVRVSLKHYLNIEIRLHEATWDEYVALLNDRSARPHIFRFGWCADYPDASNFLNDQFHPFKSANYVGWENQEFAELMDKAARETDPDQRKAFYKRAEQILCEEQSAVVPIYFERGHSLVKPRVKGWSHMAMGGQHIRDWYFDGK